MLNKVEDVKQDLKTVDNNSSSDNDSSSDGSDDNSTSSESEIDLTLSRDPKRCDFCGDLSHKSRFCSVLNQINEGEVRGTSNTGGVRVCYFCQEEGHIRSECPKRIATCFHCNKQGHIKADCPKRVEMKKRDRVTLSYTFRKPSSQKENQDVSIPPIKDVYEIPSSGSEDNNNDIKNINKNGEENKQPQRHHIFVPLPVPASQIKTPVVLRSKLLSSDSEPSISHKIMRSESSEDEDEMDSCKSSDDNESIKEKKIELEEKIKNLEIKGKILVQPPNVMNNNKDQNKNEQNNKDGGICDDELQTINIEVDGCVEFDTDDDSSYHDCSEGEDNEKRLKRIIEEDEDYGEDGALIDEDLLVDLKKNNNENINIIEEEDIDSGKTITEEVNNNKNKENKNEVIVEKDNDQQKTLT